MLKPLPFREVNRKLVAANFTRHSQKGSHIKYVRETEHEVLTVIVPHHNEIVVGTLRSIIRQARLTSGEFMDL